MDIASASLLTLTLLLMGLSLVLMVLIPVLPGQLGIWLAAVVYGFATQWQVIGLGTFVVLTLIMLASLIIDQIAGWWGAKRGGASLKGIMVGWLAGLVGAIFLNAFGAILGFLGGMMGYEYLQQNDWAHAWQTAKGYLLGQLFSLAIRLVLAVLMIVIFWVQAT